MKVHDWNVIAVINVIVENNQVLLIQENEKYEKKWYFPAGRVEVPESIVEAAIRETKEEAGLVTEPQGLLRVQHIIDPNPDAPSGYETSVRFIITSRVVGGSLKSISDADEHSMQASWFPLEELEQVNLRNKEVREIIDDYTQMDPPALSLKNMYKYMNFEDF